jgi:hypothetical protein
LLFFTLPLRPARSFFNLPTLLARSFKLDPDDYLSRRLSGGFPDFSSYVDPLSSATNCTRDLPFLEQLGVNAVRVYSVDPNANHDECMAAFSNASIYVM